MERVTRRYDDPRAAALADWLTLERVSYGAVALVALGVRLWGLSATSLSPAAAAQALPALDAAAGRMPDLAGASPLLYTLQRALFMLFGATDAAARWWPAFLGGFSPLFFYALRSRLSRGGALVAAALWAFSPLAVWGSRQALGDALAPTLALGLTALILWALDREAGSSQPQPPVLWPAAVLLGLALASGPLIYTALLAGAAALLWRPSLARHLLAAVQVQRRSAGAGLLAALVLGATFFFLTPAALASVPELLGAWLAGIAPGAGAYTPWEILRRLLLSEPLALSFGLAGLIWSIRHRDRFGQWAGASAGLALLLALLGRGRHPLDLTLAALWLVMLAGPAIARVLRAAGRWRSTVDPWLLTGLSLALLFAAAVSLPSASTPENSLAWRQVYAGVGIGATVIALLIWIAYGAYGNWDIVARALPVIPLALVGAWSLGQTASLSYEQGAWRRPAITHETGAPAAVDFQNALQQLSALQGGGARESAVDLVWPARPDDPLLPLVRWHLRDFSYLRVSGAVPSDPAPLVVTPVEDQPLLSARYSGAEYALLQRWRTDDLEGVDANLRWVLYREARTPPEALSVLLWVDRTKQ